MGPTKIPCLAKGISAGLWVDLESAWALATGLQPSPTCKRTWSAAGGHRRDFMVGCPLAVAAVLSCRVQGDRWVAPHLAVRTLFDCCRWTGRVTLGLLLGCLLLIKIGVPSRLRFKESGKFMMSVFSLCPVRMLCSWMNLLMLVMFHVHGLFGLVLLGLHLLMLIVLVVVLFLVGVWSLGRGRASFRVVKLGGHRVRKARGSAADAHDAADVFLYRDSSLAPLLDMRRRFKAVMDVLDAMIRYGISLARSVELTAQWDRILAIGPLYPVTLGDLDAGRGVGVGEFSRAVSGVHRRLCDFIHAIVVHRRDEAIRGWRNWIREDPLVHPNRWLRPDLVPPAPFLQCQPHLTPGGSGVLADPARIDEEFRKAWLPYFCRSGQRDTSLEEFDFEVEEWLPLLPEVSLPRLTGQMLADVVQRKGVSVGSLDGWWWRELKVLPVFWSDGLARILTKVEDFGIWPDGLLDAYIAMIPKTDGDATPLGQRPLSVLPIVYRVWASAGMSQLDDWFRSCVPDPVFSAGGGRGSVEAWYASSLDIEEVLSGAPDSHLHLFVADVIKSFDTVDRKILDWVLSSLGFVIPILSIMLMFG